MPSSVDHSRSPRVRGVCVGVDAGASRTSAVLTDMSGAILVPARFGPGANPNTIPFASSVAAVAALVADLWRDLVATTAEEPGHNSRRDAPPFPQPRSLAITVALSGGDTPEQCQRYRDALRERLGSLDTSSPVGCANCRTCPECARGLPPDFALAVVHDSLAPIALVLPASNVELLRGSRDNNIGGSDNVHTVYACVIAGTGSVAVCARPSRDGTLEVVNRRGGWGHLLSDEGSAYHVAVCLTRSCLRLHDIFLGGTSGAARASTSEYSEVSVVLNRLCVYHDVKVGNLPDLAAKISSAATSKAKIAGFTKHIALLAESGNQLCYQAFRDAGEELGNMLLDALQIDFTPTPEQNRGLSPFWTVRACLVGGIFASWENGVKTGFMSALARSPTTVHLFVMQADTGAALGSARLSALEHFRVRTGRPPVPSHTDARSAGGEVSVCDEVTSWNAQLGDAASYVVRPRT